MTITNKDDGIITFYTKPSGGNIAARLIIQDNGNIDIPSNNRLRIGDGQEIQIYDDGNDAFIQKTGTGGFRIDSSQTILRDDSGNHKLETTGNGVTITGTVTADGVTVGDNELIQLGNSSDLRIYHDSGSNYVGSYNNQNLVLFTNNTSRWVFQNDGHYVPIADNSYDIGTSSYRVRNIYTNDLQLSNEARKDTGGNDVDGTWGNYTIQEGESDLFLINNRSGKKYKFNLTEVN